MSKLQHTPGPWHVMEDGFGKVHSHPTVYATDDELRYIATCADYATIEKTNNLANARLIAAAPEMLEILIEDIKGKCDYCGLSTCADCNFFRTKQIIEKATGLTIEEVLTCTE